MKILYEQNICIDCYNSFKKIYMPGKISKNDWRHKIINKIGNDNIGRHDYWGIWDKKNLNEYILFGENLMYTGPFFVSCDHGCSHGRPHHQDE